MKKFILVLAIMSSVSTFASVMGLPEQDARVKNLRERFRDGVKPSLEQIIDIKWKCKEFIAGKDDNRVIDIDRLEFFSFDGFVEANSSADGFNRQVYAFNGKELTKTHGNEGNSSLRMDLNGNLISEYSYAPPHRNMSLDPYGEVSYSNSKVASYTLCVKP